MELGFRQGGAPGYGLRRLLVDERGDPKGQLNRGEQKSLQTDRVILVPGPAEEVDTVRHIYRLFVDQHQSEHEIAGQLNEDGRRTDLGREWTRGTVHQILTSEKYVGDNVYNHVSFKLKKRRVRNTRDMWIRADGVYDAIVDPDIFASAQTLIAQSDSTVGRDHAASVRGGDHRPQAVLMEIAVVRAANAFVPHQRLAAGINVVSQPRAALGLRHEAVATVEEIRRHTADG